jgi:hypothetical protein
MSPLVDPLGGPYSARLCKMPRGQRIGICGDRMSMTSSAGDDVGIIFSSTSGSPRLSSRWQSICLARRCRFPVSGPATRRAFRATCGHLQMVTLAFSMQHGETAPS